MRDKNRLVEIYNVLLAYHKKYPDIRMMQMINNFMNWHLGTYGSDGFYIEDDVFLKRIDRFMKETYGILLKERGDKNEIN